MNCITYIVVIFVSPMTEAGVLEDTTQIKDKPVYTALTAFIGPDDDLYTYTKDYVQDNPVTIINILCVCLFYRVTPEIERIYLSVPILNQSLRCLKLNLYKLLNILVNYPF